MTSPYPVVGTTVSMNCTVQVSFDQYRLSYKQGRLGTWVLSLSYKQGRLGTWVLSDMCEINEAIY